MVCLPGSHSGRLRRELDASLIVVSGSGFGFLDWFFKYVFPVFFIVTFLIIIGTIALKVWIGYQIFANPDEVGNAIGGFVGSIVGGAVEGFKGQ